MWEGRKWWFGLIWEAIKATILSHRSHHPSLFFGYFHNSSIYLRPLHQGFGFSLSPMPMCYKSHPRLLLQNQNQKGPLSFARNIMAGMNSKPVRAQGAVHISCQLILGVSRPPPLSSFVIFCHTPPTPFAILRQHLPDPPLLIRSYDKHFLIW